MTGYAFLKSNNAYITSASARNQPAPENVAWVQASPTPLLLKNRDDLYVGNGKDCQSSVTSLRDKFVLSLHRPYNLKYLSLLRWLRLKGLRNKRSLCGGNRECLFETIAQICHVIQRCDGLLEIPLFLVSRTPIWWLFTTLRPNKSP